MHELSPPDREGNRVLLRPVSLSASSVLFRELVDFVAGVALSCTDTRPGVADVTTALPAVSGGALARDLMQSTGLVEQDLADPDGRVAYPRYLRLVEEVQRRRPGFSVEFTRSRRIEGLQLFGFAIMTSRDGRDACSRAARFYGLLSDVPRVRLRDVGALGCVEFDWGAVPARSPARRAAAEIGLLNFAHSGRQIAPSAVPVRAELGDAPTADLAAMEALLGCRVETGSHYRLVYDNGALSTPLRTANDAMADFFERLVRDRLSLPAESPSSPLIGRIQHLLVVRAPSGIPSSGDVARALGMSGRTLRRELATLDTSYRREVESFRRQQAQKLIGATDSRFPEVALALGFADQSSFSRAFRRWFDLTPGEYRQLCRSRKHGAVAIGRLSKNDGR